MSAPRVARPRPSEAVFVPGDRVRKKEDRSRQALAHGTATVLEHKPKADRILVSLDHSPRVESEGSDWRHWPVVDTVRIRSIEETT